MEQRILILCTGNSCRSQMAEGILRSLDSQLEVFSAGTNPAPQISLRAVHVMKEIGIDISNGHPKSVNRYSGESFDFVITVCDHAKEACPIFAGKVGAHLHIGFEDPAIANGTEQEVLQVYRRVRDEIKEQFNIFYNSNIHTSESF